MDALFNNRKKKVLTWTIRKRAYFQLFFRLSAFYLRSPIFRTFVKHSIRHRRFINSRFVLASAKAYLLATNSRITIAGFRPFVLPHNKYGQQGQPTSGCPCRWRYSD